MPFQNRRSFGGNGGNRSRFGGNNRSRGFSRGGNRGGFRTPKTINPSLFVKKAVEPQIQEEFVPTRDFADYNLNPQLLKNIVSKGYKNQTPIQDQAIPVLLEGRDVIGIANTGTGKTAAFLIPLIHKVASDPNQNVLIIAPTRELATQIEHELMEFARGMRIFSALCIGGVNINPQMRRLSQNPHFVVGTPGRLRDLEKQRALYFEDYQNIVLDEVDQMVDMGFIQDIKYIISKLPKQRQSLFFSATLPQSALGIMHEFLYDPVKISVKTVDTAEYVEQDIVRVEGKGKLNVLHDLLNKEDFEKVIVFVRTKRGAESLARELDNRGFYVAAIHGNKSQNQRQRAIQLFKQNRVKVLLATDVASRGLDIDNVSHVINYDQPETYDDYVHRIGRTGRAGRKGLALTFVD